MKSFLSITSLCSIAACAYATASHEVFESLPSIPAGWQQLSTPSPAKQIHLRISLAQPHHALFEQTLYNISTPGHASYGQHLEREELKALLKPREESTYAVLSWLAASGVKQSDVEDDGEWINFYAPISLAQTMLNTTFHVYGHEVAESQRIRTLQYSVPANVSGHIHMIQPTTRFGQLRAAQPRITPEEQARVDFSAKPGSSRGSSGSKMVGCHDSVKPKCLRALYNIGDYEADPTVGSLFGVCGFLNQYAKYDDLDSFLHVWAQYAVGTEVSYVPINGGLNSQNDTSHDDSEANLDIQYAAAIAYNQNITYYSTGRFTVL